MSVTLILADDQPTILYGLEQLFAREPDFHVLASVGSLWATRMLSIGCPHGLKGSGRSAGLVHKSTGRGWIMRQVPNFAAVLQRADGQ